MAPNLSVLVREILKANLFVCEFAIFIKGAISKSIVPAAFGSLSLISAILTFLLPETRNCDLPKTIEDVKPNAFVAMLFNKCGFQPNSGVKKSPTQAPLLD